MARISFTRGDAVAIFTAGIVFSFVALDVFIPSIGRLLYRRNVVEALAIFGIAAAQYGLLGIWAALGPAPWFVRQPAAILGTFISYVCFLCQTRTDAQFAEQIRPIFALPLLFLCLQAPLWIARMSLGWRIVAADDIQAQPAVDARSFSLRDLFGATAVLAVAMAAARTHGAIFFLGLSLSTTCVFIATISLFASIPCVWFALGARSVGKSTVAVVTYAAISAGVVARVSASGRLVAGRSYVVSIGIFFFAMVCTMYVLLLLLRGMGFRLQRRRGSLRRR